jgi:hypothetical protein
VEKQDKAKDWGVRLRADVAVTPGALGVVVLKGTIPQRTVLKHTFGYHDGTGKRLGLLRADGTPLVHVLIGSDESNQGITLLQLQFVHFLEPTLAGRQYDELVQALGRGLRPNCHEGVPPALRFVQMRVYVVKPPRAVVEAHAMLADGGGRTADMLDLDDELSRRLEALENAHAELADAQAEMTKYAALKASATADAAEKAWAKNGYKDAHESCKPLRTLVKQLGKSEAIIRKMLEKLGHGYTIVKDEDGNYEHKGIKYAKLFPTLLDEVVWAHLCNKHAKKTHVELLMKHHGAVDAHLLRGFNALPPMELALGGVAHALAFSTEPLQLPRGVSMPPGSDERNAVVQAMKPHAPRSKAFYRFSAGSAAVERIAEIVKLNRQWVSESVDISYHEDYPRRYVKLVGPWRTAANAMTRREFVLSMRVCAPVPVPSAVEVVQNKNRSGAFRTRCAEMTEGELKEKARRRVL